MPMLTGLPGRKKSVEAAWAKTPSGFVAAIKRCGAATAAGDNGSVSAWLDDEGRYRAAFCRFLSVRELVECGSQKELREWLKVMLPQMHAGYV